MLQGFSGFLFIFIQPYQYQLDSIKDDIKIRHD